MSELGVLTVSNRAVDFISGSLEGFQVADKPKREYKSLLVSLTYGTWRTKITFAVKVKVGGFPVLQTALTSCSRPCKHCEAHDSSPFDQGYIHTIAIDTTKAALSEVGQHA